MVYAIDGVAKDKCRAEIPFTYGGTNVDVRLIANPYFIKSAEPPFGDEAFGRRTTFGTRVGMTMLGLIDLPFSLIADTVLVPFSVSYDLKRRKECRQQT